MWTSDFFESLLINNHFFLNNDFFTVLQEDLVLSVVKISTKFFQGMKKTCLLTGPHFLAQSADLT